MEAEPCIILIGKCGTVYKHGLKALERLGLTAEAGKRLMTKIHLMTIAASRMGRHGVG